MSRPSIVIIGAGIGGLNAAHELSLLTGKDAVDIDVYEQTHEIGGMARSSRDNHGCATEYSWRYAAFWFYRNLLSLYKEIPFHDTEHTVYDNLIVTNTKLFRRREQQKQPLRPMLGFAKRLWEFATSCDERAKLQDQIPFVTGSSEGQLFNALPQYFGLDKEHGSSYSVMKVGMENLVLRKGNKDYVFNQPTSEAWFNPWLQLLQRRGVRFHFGHRLEQIQFHSYSIGSVSVRTNGILKQVQADAYILNLPVQELALLVQHHPQWPLRDPQMHHIPELAKRGRILQLCFQVHFDRPILLNTNTPGKNGFTLIDSPWELIIQTRENLYAASGAPLCSKLPAVRGSWSVLCGQDRVRGMKHQKPFSLCTEQEIHEELWAQIEDNDQLLEAVVKHNGFELSHRYIVNWSPLWPTFYYNSQQTLDTSEPKFSNNVGTLQLRPSCKTAYSNLAICGAYTREAIDIFSMEGATISGRTAAYLISAGRTRPVIKAVDRPLFFKPFRAVDQVLYKHRISNVFTTIIVFGLIALVIYCIFKVGKQKVCLSSSKRTSQSK